LNSFQLLALTERTNRHTNTFISSWDMAPCTVF